MHYTKYSHQMQVPNAFLLQMPHIFYTFFNNSSFLPLYHFIKLIADKIFYPINPIDIKSFQ